MLTVADIDRALASCSDDERREWIRDSLYLVAAHKLLQAAPELSDLPLTTREMYQAELESVAQEIVFSRPAFRELAQEFQVSTATGLFLRLFEWARGVMEVPDHGAQ